MVTSSVSAIAALRRRIAWQDWKYLAAAVVLGVLHGGLALSQDGKPAVSCESLRKMTLPDTTITMAQTVGAGEFKVPSQDVGGPVGPAGPGRPGAGNSFSPTPDVKTLPAFCRVAATLKPTSDSAIKIEVWLPLQRWNGNLLGVGGGGWAGHIFYVGNPIGLTDGLRARYASANTDAGHEGSGGEFIPGHPEKLIDYGYRANHEMTVKAKAIITAFYGNRPKHSVFVGCSLGSTQALTEAKRFPADYDGVVAGAPMTPISVFNAVQIWPGWLVSKDPSKFIPRAKYTMIHESALKACAGAVGRKQGFIEEPDRCHFDPGTLLCKGPDRADCLTAPQVKLMRQIYEGPVDPRTKKPIFPGPRGGGRTAIVSVRRDPAISARATAL